jgi:photosystem II stability/assembly factor-like uncharacterized protein
MIVARMPRRRAVRTAMAALLLSGLSLGAPHAEAITSVAKLGTSTHFHGIAVDPQDSSRILLATHNGLYSITPDGKARRISLTEDDFMGFSSNPGDPARLFASGHPAGGGNLGFLASSDGGRNWRQLSPGVGGPVDFHQIAVSPADPNVIFGTYNRDIQMSGDGGRSWTIVAAAPPEIIDLAASAKDVNTLYAAARTGLFKSMDRGRSWKRAYEVAAPVTSVHVRRPGEVIAFVVGTGLVMASEPTLDWRVIGPGFAGGPILHFDSDPNDANTLYAVAVVQSHGQAVIASRDGGKTWTQVGTEKKP